MAKIKASITFYVYYKHETFPNSARIRLSRNLNQQEISEACERFSKLTSVKRAYMDGADWLELKTESRNGKKFKDEVTNLAELYYTVTEIHG